MRNLYNILSWAILIAFCWLVPIITTGQAPAVYNINKYNGLTTNHVYSTLVDKHGYLWLCSPDGVYRYNGYSLKRYDYNDGLPNTDVWDMYEDKSGKIWLMSIADGIGYIKENVYHPAVIKNDSICETIYPGAFVEKDSMILFGLKNSSDEFHVYGKIINDTVELRKKRFNAFSGLFNILPDKLIIASGAQLSYYPINVLLEDGDLPQPKRTVRTNIQIASAFIYQSVINRLHKNVVFFSAINTRKAFFFDFNENVLDTISIHEHYDPILHIHVYKDDIWILTGSIAYRVNLARKITDTIYYNRLFSPMKKNYTPVFFMPDKFWGKCLSTTNEGIYMNYGGASSFRQLNDLLNDYIYLSPSGDSGAYWRNDRQNKLVEIVNGTVLKKQFQLDKSLVVNKIIPFSKEKSILIASTTIRWLYPNGTSTGFLDTDTFVYNKNIFTSDYNHFYSAVSDVLVIDTTNFIFLASGYAGANHVTTYPGQQKIHAITFDAERYEDVLYYPNGGFCILYNSRKVLLYDAFNRTKVAISTDILKALRINSIEKIDVDKYGNLIIKTYDRLILFNPITCKIKRLFPNYNFHNSFINISGDTLSIAGNFGVAWCKTTSNGKIIDLRTYPNTKALFYKYIYDVQFSRGSILLKTDNGAYMVSINGTSNAILDKYKLVVNNEGTLIDINAKDTFIVNPTTEVLEVDVIKPTGTGQLNIEYSINNEDYKNTGYQVILPALKPGSYNTISLIASDDSWRSKPIKFTIYIQPKWWQTQTAKRVIVVLSLLAFIGFIYVVIVMTRRFVNRANERRNQRRELELKSIYSQINPHFIFNSLSTAQYFVKKNQNKEAFEHINQFSDLLRAYIKSSRAKYITIAEEIENLKNYLQLQLTRFEEKFEYSIDIHPGIDPAKVKVPSLLLQPLVENALNHGIFHSDKKGNLSIIFKIEEQDKDTLVCIVDDDGIGRQKSKEMRGKIIRKADSYGTILIKELIDAFNKYEKINIEIEYIDKQLPLTGTTVIIRIKNFTHAQ